MMRRLLRQLAILAVLALVPAAVSGVIQLRARPPEPLEPGEVRLATVNIWGDAVLWVDARAPAQYEHEHIPGAVPLNEDEWNTLLPAFFDAYEPGKAVVVYCDGGGCEASQAVAERLRNEGQLKNVWVLKGGWNAWRRK